MNKETPGLKHASLFERFVLPHGGRLPPVRRSVPHLGLELLRAALFLPVAVFIWAVYLARIAYLVAFVWWESSEFLTPSFPHQASAMRSKVKKILRDIWA